MVKDLEKTKEGGNTTAGLQKVKVPVEVQRDAAVQILMGRRKDSPGKKKKASWEICLKNDVLKRIQEGKRKVILSCFYEDWERVFPGDQLRFINEDNIEATFSGRITEIRFYEDLDAMLRTTDLEAAGMKVSEAEEGIKKQKATLADKDTKALMAVYFTVEK